jgi:hypothetical protein
VVAEALAQVLLGVLRSRAFIRLTCIWDCRVTR